MLLVPQIAAAEDVAANDIESQMQALQERLTEMEQRLQATDDALEASKVRVEEQQQVLEQAGLDERGSKNALSTFLNSTEFSGVIAASYNWNQANPKVSSSGQSPGQSGFAGNGPIAMPFHPDHNTFQLDEFSLAMDREPTEDMRAGFGAEVMFGKTATIVTGKFNGNGNDVWLRRAHIDYLSPLAGIQFTFGKFDTHIGYETVGAAENWTITRGFTYNTLQPISQIGIKLGSHYDSGFKWMIGGVNGVNPNDPDTDDQKGAIATFGWENDTVNVAVNMEFDWDVEAVTGVAGNTDSQWIFDLVTTVNPTDALALWLNATYRALFLDNHSVANPAGPGNRAPWGLGVNVGTHYQVTDRFGGAVRFEWERSEDDGSGVNFLDPVGTGLSKADAIGVTLTLDYALTDDLLVRAEGVYNRILGGWVGPSNANDIFPVVGNDPSTWHKYQMVGLVQVVYQF